MSKEMLSFIQRIKESGVQGRGSGWEYTIGRHQMACKGTGLSEIMETLSVDGEEVWGLSSGGFCI